MSEDADRGFARTARRSDHAMRSKLAREDRLRQSRRPVRPAQPHSGTQGAIEKTTQVRGQPPGGAVDVDTGIEHEGDGRSLAVDSPIGEFMPRTRGKAPSTLIRLTPSKGSAQIHAQCAPVSRSWSGPRRPAVRRRKSATGSVCARSASAIVPSSSVEVIPASRLAASTSADGTRKLTDSDFGSSSRPDFLASSRTAAWTRAVERGAPVRWGGGEFRRGHPPLSIERIAPSRGRERCGLRG